MIKMIEELQALSLESKEDSEKTLCFSEVLDDLKAAFPDSNIVSTDPEQLAKYANSVFPQTRGLPHNVIVHVRSTDDVVKVVQISRKHLVPIVPYSGGTSLEGNLTAHGDGRGSICIDMAGMNKIFDINEADADVRCEAGVVWNELNDVLQQKGVPLFFPLDPARGATIGGIIATGCSGTNAVRYGTARGEYILNLTAVLPSGDVIKTRRRARKSSAGFDLTKLFVGAEGTLGIVTEATLRLAPLLPTTVAAASFPNVREATQAVIEILNQGASIQCAELMDDVLMKCLNLYGNTQQKWREVDTVFFKYQGSSEVMRETSNIVEKTVRNHGAFEYSFISDEKEASLLWEDRKGAAFGILKTYPGRKMWITDVCVPVSSLPDLVYAAKEDLAKRNLIAPLGGHVGDGNFHAAILYANDEELQSARDIAENMCRKALELGGTSTGEHGIGTYKRHLLVEELGEGTVALMRTIKNTMDPHNLFNPGKLYPDP